MAQAPVFIPEDLYTAFVNGELPPDSPGYKSFITLYGDAIEFGGGATTMIDGVMYDVVTPDGVVILDPFAEPPTAPTGEVTTTPAPTTPTLDVTSILTGSLSFLEEKLRAVAERILGPVGGALRNLISGVDGILGSLIGSIRDAATSLTAVVSDMSGVIGGAIQSAMSSIATNISGIFATVANTLRDAFDGVAGLVVDAINPVMDGLRDTLGNLGSVVGNIGNSIHDGVARGVGAIRDLLEPILTDIQRMIPLLIEGLGDRVGDVVEALGAAGKGIAGAFAEILSQPLGAFADQGRNILEMLPEPDLERLI